jgi:AAHS family 4-hydroxybenzoate transporter-like MFS transporter
MHDSSGRDSSGFNVSAFITNRAVGWGQWSVVLWCVGVLLAEGYDLFCIGYVAPAIIREWGFSSSSFGMVFSASIFGLLIGNLTVGPLADRFGRRITTACGVIGFGLLTLAATAAGTLQMLVVLRFLAGIGLGAAAPGALALSAEFLPLRRRSLAISLTILAMSVGSLMAAAVAVTLAGPLGWRIVFYFGAVWPVVMGLAMLRLMPESVRLLSLRPGNDRRIAASLARVFPGADFDPARRYYVTEQEPKGFPVWHLFTEGRARSTGLLWAAFLLSQMSGIFMAMYQTIAIHEVGVPPGIAALISSMLSVGGIVGGLAFIPLVARFGPLATGCQFVFAGLMIAGIGALGTSTASFMVMTFLAGAGVIGGQVGNVALAGMFYPTGIRSTGVGWALGAGRCGAIIGPLLGGLLLGRHVPVPVLFAFAGVPAFCAGMAYFVMSRLPRLDRVPEQTLAAMETSS